MKPAATALYLIVFFLMYALSSTGQSNNRFYFISDRYSNRDSICVVTYIGKRELENLLVWEKYPRPIEALGTDKSIRHFLLENGFAVISKELVDMPTYGIDILAQDIAENKYGAWKSSNEYSRRSIKKPTNVNYYWKIVSCDSPNSIIVVDIYKPISGQSKFSIENIKVWERYKNNFVPEAKIGSSFKNYLLRYGFAEIIDNTKKVSADDMEAQRGAAKKRLGLWKYQKQLTSKKNPEEAKVEPNPDPETTRTSQKSNDSDWLVDLLRKIGVLANFLRENPTIEKSIRTPWGKGLIILLVPTLILAYLYIVLFKDRVKSILRELFSKKVRILIVGPINAGKTTFWRHFANADSAPPDKENIKPHIEHLRSISRSKQLLPASPIICEAPNIYSVPNFQGISKKFKKGILLIVLRIYDNDNKLVNYEKQEQLAKAILIDISSKKISPSHVFILINTNPDKSEDKIDTVASRIRHKEYFETINSWFQKSKSKNSYQETIWLNITNQKEVENFYFTLFKK